MFVSFIHSGTHTLNGGVSLDARQLDAKILIVISDISSVKFTSVNTGGKKVPSLTDWCLNAH